MKYLEKEQWKAGLFDPVVIVIFYLPVFTFLKVRFLWFYGVLLYLEKTKSETVIRGNTKKENTDG